MRKTIAVFCFAALLAIASAVAQPAGDGPPNRFRGPGAGGQGGPGLGCLIDYLELTDDQVAAWDAIQAEIRGTLAGTMSEHREIRQEIRAELDSGSPDPTVLGELMIASHEIGQQARSVRESAHDDFAGVLTDDQREKYEIITAYQEACRGAFGGEKGFGRGGRGGRGGNGGPPQD